MDAWKLSQFIKHEATALGFDACGISKAAFLEDDAEKLDNWLSKGLHGKMNYMQNHFDKRLDPTKLVPGSKSVISLSYNYFTTKSQQHPDAPKISMYAYGKDYHDVIKKKLKSLLKSIETNVGEISGRCFVDSAPVMERSWAQKSGLGWVGKNTLLLTKQKGSFIFLAEIIIDLELAYDGPVKDYCGNCTKCIDACPTNAIYAPYKMDGSKCISYFTIELKDEVIPKEMEGKFENWAFGCDICQNVCPINSQARPHSEPAFEPSAQLLNMNRKEWVELTEEVFNNVFENSPVKRTKFSGLKRNLNFIMKPTGKPII